MRFHAALAVAVISAAMALPAAAADTAQQTAMKGCAANWKTMSAADKGKTKYQEYMGTCMKGGAKAAAAPMAAPAAATTSSMAMTAAKPAAATAESGSAKCKDGKVVSYKHRQGTCSGHGGVATWM